MSRITKYLNQTARVQLMKRTSSGQPILDAYGEPVFNNMVTSVRCRKEQSTKDVLTSTGAVKKNCTVYYLDCNSQFSIGDLVDTKPILTIKDMIDISGKCVGYEVTV